MKSSVFLFSTENKTEHYTAIAYCIQVLTQPVIDFDDQGNVLKSIWDTRTNISSIPN